jgi:AcrR family transcriptional regulator
MGIAERKQLEKSARKKLILDCALAAFREKGFADATIADIANRADIAQGTIYLYFKSKADLYFSLTKPALENLSEHLKRIASDKSDEPDVKIRKLMYAVYEFYIQDTDAYNLITRYKAAENQDLFPKDRLKFFAQLMRSNLKQMEIAIEEGIRKGVLREIDPYSGAVVFWSSFIGIIQFQENRMMPGKGDYRKATLDLLIETMLDGLRKK